nr:MAG TPA: hypothetical protein [Caudoviricetes sp.]
MNDLVRVSGGRFKWRRGGWTARRKNLAIPSCAPSTCSTFTSAPRMPPPRIP